MDNSKTHAEVTEAEISPAPESSTEVQKDEHLTNPMINGDNSNDLTRHDDVVVVTEVLGPTNLEKTLIRNICYLSQAYNGKRKYDIFVFTS